MAWDEATATWNQAASGNAWDTSGANGVLDRDSLSLCTVNAGSTGPIEIPLNNDGLALLQSWVDGGTANSGIVIVDSATPNGADFDSSESATAMSRPKLEVTYTLPASPPNQLPTSTFSDSCTYLDCNFTDTSSDPDGSVVGWSWDFGDGNSSTAQNPAHSYVSAGTYPVSLTVTDDGGDDDTVNDSVSVSAPPPPNLLANPGFELDFQSWDDWGNSFIETGTVHSGAKAARLGPAQGGRVQNVTGLVAGTVYTMCAWSRVDSVTNLSWMGVNIYDASVTQIGTYQWGVAWTSWQQNSVTFTYPANGDYIDVWVWTDPNTNPTYVDDFTLVEGATCAGGNVAPTAAFSVSTSDLTATFTDTSSDSDGSIASWSWDFGDGNSSTSQNPVHVYASAGSYSVELTVTDNEGATDMTTDSVVVQIGSPTAAYPFPQHISYAAGTISPNHRSQSQLDDDVRAFYDYWKSSFLVSAGTSSGGNPMYRVTFGSGNPGSTVSEGQGFGMMIVAIMAGYDPLAKVYFFHKFPQPVEIDFGPVDRSPP